MEHGMYEKARRLVDEDRVRLVDETDKRAYLEVEGSQDTYGIRVESDHTFSCTCPYATMRGIPQGALCSHVLAALAFLTDEESPWRSSE